MDRSISQFPKNHYNYLMIELNIPGRESIRLEHLVCDVNGTLALDGKLMEGVSRQINLLRDRLQIHLLTANSFGRQSLIDQQLGLTAQMLQTGPGSGTEQAQKAQYIQQLGAEHVAAFGQGANDALMLRTAALGVCVLSPEGAAVETLLAADLCVPTILNAFELFEKPLRLIATLRK
jgi:soluble P-type ATPase